MQSPRPRTRKIAAWLAVFATVLAGLVAIPAAPASATTPNKADFVPGMIVSDNFFFNGGAMTAEEVQSFLNSHVSGGRCTIGDAGREAGKVVYYRDGSPDTIAPTCLKDWHQATENLSANAQCAAYSGSPDETAAQIIYKVGVACNLSQSALIVLLEKEQALVTDNWPWMRQYNFATGSNCPDSSGCDPAYGGFFFQVYGAAQQFQRYGTGSFTWYPVGATTAVRWSPDASCGSSPVYIQNRATAALYYYTPYQPNAAAMNNLYGTGDACSAYGNRNFWRLSVEWFDYPTVRFRASPTPVVSGSLMVGGTLHANLGSWSPSPTTSGAQWMRDGVDVSSATGSDYVLSADDVGHRLSVRTSGSRSGYATTTRTSLATSAVISESTELAAVVPARIVDTRASGVTVDHLNEASGAVGPGQTLRVPVLGRAGLVVPSSGVSAVVLNVTAVAPTASGHARVYPTGEALPNTSNVNFTAGQTIPNLVVAKVGSDGSVSIYNAAGYTHFVVDVAGYFPDVSGYSSLSPSRLVDTRSDGVTVDHEVQATGAVGAAQSLQVPVLNRGGVPASGVSAVVLNVTAISPTSGGYAAVYPKGESPPNASNLNFTAGKTIPNLVIAKVGADGSVSIFNAAGNTHFAVDVMGYFPEVSGYTPLSPLRLADTRSGFQTVDHLIEATGPVGSAQTLRVPVLGRGGVPASGVTAVVVNVTAVAPTAGGHLRVYPTGEALPNTSNVNFTAGTTIPNSVIAKVGADGSISIYNAAGNTHVIVDVAGWFAAS